MVSLTTGNGFESAGPFGILERPFTCICGYSAKTYERLKKHTDQDPSEHFLSLGDNMSKDDLMAVHAVLNTIREKLEQIGIAQPEDFERYDQIGITPGSISVPKTRHRQALLALLGDLYLALQSEEPS